LSSSTSEEDESVKQSRHLQGAKREAVDINDSVGADDDDDDDADESDDVDDDDEWEDIDDEWVTDSDEHEADCIQSAVADNSQCDTTSNCPDILTGPQLIDLLRSLCIKANRHADVHTIGLVCMHAICPLSYRNLLDCCQYVTGCFSGVLFVCYMEILCVCW